MKAVIYKEKDTVELTDVPDPEIQSPTDAIVEIDMCSVCGLDIHAVHGTLGEMAPGTVLGHEGIGRVHETLSQESEAEENYRRALGMSHLHVDSYGRRDVRGSCLGDRQSLRQYLFHCRNDLHDRGVKAERRSFPPYFHHCCWQGFVLSPDQ